MSKEIPSGSSSEILDIKSLSLQNKMNYILGVFDLVKDGKSEERKNKFLDLLRKYNTAYIKSEAKIVSKKNGEEYSKGRAKLHNEIMQIIKNMSLSKGLTSEQREVTSYLAENRDEVTRMISSYFSGIPEVGNTKSDYVTMKENLNYNFSKGGGGPEEE